jgi:uncharacterized membrane protein YdjX (TVP38/TMEM64 family)
MPQLESAPPPLTLPRSLEDVAQLRSTLALYRTEHSAWLLFVFAFTYVCKQAFSIPGSVFLNLLAGAVFGWRGGAVLVCTLTTVGATCCYLMSRFYGRALAQRVAGDKLQKFSVVVAEKQEAGGLFFYLLFLRLIPASPNWFLNLASPLVGVPLHLFSLSVFVGLMPYNLICVHAGTVLGTITSLDDVMTTATMLRLTALALLSLAPAYLQELVKDGTRFYNKGGKKNRKEQEEAQQRRALNPKNKMSGGNGVKPKPGKKIVINNLFGGVKTD